MIKLLTLQRFASILVFYKWLLSNKSSIPLEFISNPVGNCNSIWWLSRYFFGKFDTHFSVTTNHNFTNYTDHLNLVWFQKLEDWAIVLSVTFDDKMWKNIQRSPILSPKVKYRSRFQYLLDVCFFWRYQLDFFFFFYILLVNNPDNAGIIQNFFFMFNIICNDVCVLFHQYL